MDTKPWWQSKTIWGVIVTFLTQILKPFGINLTDADSAELVNHLLNLVSFIAAIIAIYGRVRASKPIAPKDAGGPTLGTPLMRSLIAFLLPAFVLFSLAGCTATGASINASYTDPNSGATYHGGVNFPKSKLADNKYPVEPDGPDTPRKWDPVDGWNFGPGAGEFNADGSPKR